MVLGLQAELMNYVDHSDSWSELKCNICLKKEERRKTFGPFCEFSVWLLGIFAILSRVSGSLDGCETLKDEWYVVKRLIAYCF